jgi:protein-S-isoprenylcysteine O-methyltransferase Ste14
MGWATWLVLGVVLWTKARIEERLMLEQHENYGNYRQHTQRFVPWLW